MEASGSINTSLVLQDSMQGQIGMCLVLQVSGLAYTPIDPTQPEFRIEIGPIITTVSVFGVSKIASGATVDVFPKGTDPAGIAIGHGISSAVVGSTGKVYLNIWLGPASRWSYRIAYPYGVMAPDKEVITISDIPFEQGKYEW